MLDKAPRRRERCNYCNTDKGGLAAFTARRPTDFGCEYITFCGPYCAAWYENCLFYRHLDRPPDQYELHLQRPP